MSRGQQGIGISAAGMYGQLTTGKPVQIISRTGPRAAGALLRGPDRHQEERAPDPREQADRLGPPARHPGHDRGRGPVPEGPRLGGRVPRADRHRQSARQAHVPHAGRRDEGVPADDPASCAERRARSSRIPTASSSACCSRCSRTPRATRSPGSSRATSAGCRRAWPRRSARRRGSRRARGRATSTGKRPRRSTRPSRRPRSWRRRPTACRPSASRRSWPASTSRSRASSTRR